MRRAGLVGGLAAAAVAVAGCGSREASVLQTAFKHPIKSANVTLTVDVPSPQGAFDVSLSGPYKSNGEGKLPSLDWQLHLAAAGKAVDGELISTGDDAFIKYEGQTYEVGKATIRKLQRRSAQEQSLQRSFKAADLSQLMRKAQGWFPQSDTQQDAKLDGEAVTRVTGRLDLSKAAKDIAQMIQGDQGITQKDLRKLDRQVSDPRFTVDVGKSDGKLRRILTTLRIRGQGAVRFQVRYRDVDKPVTIDAPASGLPLSQLEQTLQHDFGGSSASTGSGSSA